MEKLVKGTVVIIPFPFSDLNGIKKRPALVLATLEGDDVVLCQITSQRSDKYSITLTPKDFSQGSLPVQSNIRPNKLFTADTSLILSTYGILHKHKVKETIYAVCNILQDSV